MTEKYGKRTDKMRQLKTAARVARGRKRAPAAPGKKRRGGIAKGKAAQASAQRPPARGARLVTQFIDRNGVLALDNLAAGLGMTRGQLADTVGLRRETLQRRERAAAPKTQTRVREMLEIVGRVTEWAGGMHQAMAWYRAEPIAEFGGRTAEALVKEGKAAAVRHYLDHVALGGFA
jgi:hypothetical protein